MKIAIKFHDSDFTNTFLGVLEVIKKSNLPLNKEQLCEIINEISYGVYLVYQEGFEYEDRYHIKNYLRIETKNILLHGEVDDYLRETEEIDIPDVFCIYDDTYSSDPYEVRDKWVFLSVL